MGALVQPWITGSDIIDMRGADAIEGIDRAVLDTAAQAASEVLYVLTGRQFPGPARATLRPARRRAGYSVGEWINLYSMMVGSVYFGGGGSNGLGWGWGYCFGDDHGRCGDRRSVELGVYPIRTVNAVTVNGVVLDPSKYTVENDRYLVRLDGGHWDLCQDINAVDGADGTWSVDVTYGADLPASARSAAVSLALETGKAYSGMSNVLPSRVTSVTRQQVSWVLLDPMAFIENGKTGLYDVDLFIGTYNPTGMRTKPRVLSPDTARTTRRVGPITAGG